MGYGPGRSKSISIPKVDHREYDLLPAALQRKYFSSLERLRLAQDGFFSTANRRPQTSLRNAQFHSDQRSTCSERLSSRRLHKSKTATAAYLALQADTELFMSLPLKLQQSHFSREEQILLAGTGDTVIFDAADETILRLSQQTPAFVGEIFPMEPEEATAFNKFCWGEERDKLDLSLDEYHAAIADTVNSNRSAGRGKPSFRRNLSVSSVQFQQNSLSSRKQSQSSLPSAAFGSSISNYSRPVSTLLGPRHKSHASLSTIDPTAQHYRDPEARLKLRVYLASPQKFDEALEFGFPSIDNKEKIVQARPATSAGLTKNRVFFRDDADSIYDEEPHAEDEDASADDSDNPPTPREPEFQPFSTSEKSSMDKPVHRWVVPRTFSEPYAGASASKREMTLHMTLTRPDLRTADELPSAVMPVSEPTPGTEHFTPEQKSIWDTLPIVEESRMKRLWKKIRRT